MSSADLDRYNERMLPEAFTKHLDLYRSNPVILAGHQSKLDDGMPPVIGKAAKVWVDKRGLWAIIEFAQTGLAEQYWQFCRDGYMKAVSIGFRPTPGGTHFEMEGTRRVLVYDEVELYEISCVAVPANSQALVRSKQAKRDFVAQKIRDRELAELAELGYTPERLEADAEKFTAAIMGTKVSDYFAAMVGGKTMDGDFFDEEIINDGFCGGDLADEDDFAAQVELSAAGDDEPDYVDMIGAVECKSFTDAVRTQRQFIFE